MFYLVCTFQPSVLIQLCCFRDGVNWNVSRLATWIQNIHSPCRRGLRPANIFYTLIILSEVSQKDPFCCPTRFRRSGRYYTVWRPSSYTFEKHVYIHMIHYTVENGNTDGRRPKWRLKTMLLMLIIIIIIIIKVDKINITTTTIIIIINKIIVIPKKIILITLIIVIIMLIVKIVMDNSDNSDYNDHIGHSDQSDDSDNEDKSGDW